MANTNVIQLNNIQIELLRRAVEKRKSGNLEGALSILHSLEDSGAKYVDIFSQIAKCYMELELYELAMNYWFKFLDCAPKHLYVYAYNGLGACSYYLDDFQLATYYFERQIDTEQEVECDYDNVLIELYDQVNEHVKPKFYVAYPPAKADTSKVIANGDNYVLNGEYDSAISVFETVDENNENYEEAQYKIASCYYYKGDMESAKTAFNRLIERDINKNQSIITLINMLISNEEREEAEKYLQIIENENLDVYELARIAPAYLELGKIEQAKKALEIVASEDYYDINSTYLLGQVYYNSKEFEKAKEKFTLCYKLTKSANAKYFIDLCNQTMKDESIFEKNLYNFNIPTKEAKKRIAFIEKIIKDGKKFIAKQNKTILLEYVDWLFTFDSRLQNLIIDCLLTKPYLVVRKYFLNKLLDYSLNDGKKTLIIQKLVEEGYNKKIGVVLGGVYIKLQLLRAEFDTEKNEIFTKAFARAFSIIAPMVTSNHYKIVDGAYKLYYLLKDNGNLKKINDENALSGAISFCAKLRISSEMGLICQYFNTKQSDVQNILELAGVSDEDY